MLIIDYTVHLCSKTILCMRVSVPSLLSQHDPLNGLPTRCHFPSLEYFLLFLCKVDLDLISKRDCSASGPLLMFLPCCNCQNITMRRTSKRHSPSLAFDSEVELFFSNKTITIYLERIGDII